MLGAIVAGDVSRWTAKTESFDDRLLRYAKTVKDWLAMHRSSRAKLRANSCAPSFAAFSFSRTSGL
jgi:hypothetical protein